MKILNKQEIEGFLAQGKLLPDSELTIILDSLERELPGIYRIIYGEPSDFIAEVNKEMANLYLDLSFDVVWVFKCAFGNPPKLKIDTEKWVLGKLSLLGPELNSLAEESSMNSRFKKNLQDRFVKRSLEAALQLNLLKHLEQAVTKYASFNKKRKIAIHITRYWLFIFVRLMCDLYAFKEK